MEKLLDFGLQPVCSHFLSKKEDSAFLTPLVFSCCRTCGLIQNSCPPVHDQLRPKVDFISYREPEEHLDDLADYLCRLEGLCPDSFIAGLTVYDQPLVDRLKAGGFRYARRVDRETEYGIKDRISGVETLQEKITAGCLEGLSFRGRKPDLILAGFILEHAHDLSGFIHALRNLLNPSGYISIQVPDFECSLETLDYSAIWEEHKFYFTKDTLSFCPVLGDFKTVFFKAYPHRNGTVLSSIWQESKEQAVPLWKDKAWRPQFEKADAYRDNYEKSRASLKSNLVLLQKRKGRIALFGAGHQACIFINLLDIPDFLEFVVDDDKRKQGLYMPGSGLEIKGSEGLISGDIKVCLMAVSKHLEPVIKMKNKDFIDRGGCFESIYNPDLYSTGTLFLNKGGCR